uniref:solute carrier family 13 member 5-like isoform X2 n=1 Tax=Styela clava TaxID=7725 RepID=UPI00193AD5C5|nr:solute carrier family 13 member 5-like isoform X2 [Styela clava]
MSLAYFFTWIRRFQKSVIFLLTPILFLPLLIMGTTKVSSCGYVICLMGVYWTTEACPLVVTSFMPILLFPIFGIQTVDAVSMSYMRHVCFLFLGAFVLCIAIEEWNLHRRFALRVLLFFGSRPCWIMLGMMFITGFLSMWLSNSSTCALMHPITVALCREISTAEKKKRCEETQQEVKEISDEVFELPENTVNAENIQETIEFLPESDRKNETKRDETLINEEISILQDEEAINLEKSMLLAVTYSSTFGGTCTTVGTPSNLVAIGIFATTFGKESSKDLNFVSWFLFCLPMAIVFIFITWIWVLFRFRNIGQLRSRSINKISSKRIKEMIQAKNDKLPPMRYAQDSTTAVLVAMSLFLFPSKLSSFSWMWKKKTEQFLPPTSPTLLSWNTFQRKFPWDVMLLVGAGFSLAKACVDSGLSEWFGASLTTALQGIPAWAVLLVISITISLLTEFSSNLATTSVFLPIMMELSRDLNINPVFILLITTLSSSFAFSLPIATPANALAFTFGSLRVMDMVTTGLPLNFVCVGILNVFVHLTGVHIFHLDAIPVWALGNNTNVTFQNNTTAQWGR